MQDPFKIQLQGGDNSFSVRAGEQVELEIPENPTTGFRWELSCEPKSAVEMLGSRFLRSTGGVGAGGLRVWTLRISEPATVHLEAALRQRWEPSATPEDLARVELKVF